MIALKGSFKTGVINLGGVLLFAGLIQAAPSPDLNQAGSVNWYSEPKEDPNGWYWMYDDASEPPFDEPELTPMPAPPYSDYTIHEEPTANKLAPYNDLPFLYSMPDSFWFYGYWFTPGEYLYISPDGWISFDNQAQSGYPDPPSSDPVFPNTSAPNMVIAPLWADYDPTRTPGSSDHNRVYYLYENTTREFTVEWYQVEGNATGNTYTFQVRLEMGGQGLLESHQDCGVVFSHHLIEFLYHAAVSGWTGDDGAAGFEDPDGVKGITYEGLINTSGDSFHAVRSGYKRVFNHDVAAYEIISPGRIVLRHTPIEPKVVVANLGQETEHFTVGLSTADKATGEVVYDHSLGVYDLLPGQMDTLAAPCWTPGEITTSYRVVLDVGLDRDSCQANNQYVKNTTVGCDDTVSYLPTTDIGCGFSYNVTNDFHLASFFPCDDGVLVMGAAIRSPGSSVSWLGGVWEAEQGCGLPQDPPIITAEPTWEDEYGVFSFPYGLFVHSCAPGNVWVGAIPTSSQNPAVLCGYPFIIGDRAPDHPCYMGNGNPTAVRSYGEWEWPYFRATALQMKVFLHLGFGLPPLSPRPAPPCWEGGVHDLACSEIVEPGIDYIEAGKSITPEVLITNLGGQKETDSGFVETGFMVVDPGKEPGEDTVYSEKTLIDEIGYLGDPSDDPDSQIVAFPPWSPEGRCDRDSSITSYELIGVVKLGKIGPDKTDHCPYNDTVRRTVECLFSHNVGVSLLELEPEPNSPPDWYQPGTDLTITVTVENYGFNAEHDIPVRCEIRDEDDANVLLWHSLKEIEVLDWRGNQLDRPHTTQVVFSGFTTPNQHRMKIECLTELSDDQCPDDDAKTRHINTGITEAPVNTVYYMEVSSSPVRDRDCRVRMGVPFTTRVKIEVLDVSGRRIALLADRRFPSGHHELVWLGRDDRGRRVGAGIYIVRMKAEEFCTTKKVVLLN